MNTVILSMHTEDRYKNTLSIHAQDDHAHEFTCTKAVSWDDVHSRTKPV